ncbi:hypothetical protein OG871_15880 [Kitasatospora sp. NBC_00374]|uniref:hypothetical protein n=1 Tax=Kitasatospora sp. NBC_00374 TaxID=2975964 RepID=UPI003245E956
MAVHLDSFMDGSLVRVGGSGLRERYLGGISESLRAYGPGYFGTRNIEIEYACHEVVPAVLVGCRAYVGGADGEFGEWCWKVEVLF